MGKIYDALTEKHISFINNQKIFFIATAPGNGRINLSPKGTDCFRVVDQNRVQYLDLTGSGNETAAHLRENSRITLMFCSFTEEPKILRLYGKGIAYGSNTSFFAENENHFPDLPGARQIMEINIDSAQTSCGFGVPLFEFKEQRETLNEWAEKKGEEGIRDYWHRKNRKSIDGLPTGIDDQL